MATSLVGVLSRTRLRISLGKRDSWNASPRAEHSHGPTQHFRCNFSRERYSTDRTPSIGSCRPATECRALGAELAAIVGSRPTAREPFARRHSTNGISSRCSMRGCPHSSRCRVAGHCIPPVHVSMHIGTLTCVERRRARELPTTRRPARQDRRVTRPARSSRDPSRARARRCEAEVQSRKKHRLNQCKSHRQPTGSQVASSLPASTGSRKAWAALVTSASVAHAS